MIGLIIYLVGFIFAYVLCKRIRNRQNENEWNDVFWTIVAGFLSWISFFVFLIAELTNNKKPPKWL